MKRFVGLALVVTASSSCLVPREPSGRDDRTCTSCHGDSQRVGDAVSRAAPPFDLYGNTDPRYPGVGSHQRHLAGSESFAPVPCASCHPVPERVNSDGHDDGVTQVLVTLLDGGGPAYRLQTCAGSACHPVASGVWTRPRSSAEACGSCHGLPPAPPHPQVGECASCHGALTAQTHVDGVVTRVDTRCDACHGSDATGAPPRALDGGTSVSQRGVGAHQAHLSGGQVSQSVPCATCHEVPASVATPRHPNGGPAELKAVGFDPSAATCVNACHANTPIGWTTPGPLSCTGCHGAPPAAPHPQSTNCAACHPAVSADNRGHHVNGTVDLSLPSTCDGCHGSTANPAPPRALDGGTSISQRGVGAHQAHLSGGRVSQPVACDTCHEVPATASTPHHPNGGPAELKAIGFDAGTATCVNACHANTPVAWATPGPLSCSGCHGAPPAAPHPQSNNCALCHPSVAADNRGHHVNGTVDLALPNTCDGCHGSAANPAPPRDLDGGVDTSRPGVGAHQAHLVGRGLARPVLCGECHQVPATVRAAGHLDGVTQLKFSGVAVNGVLNDPQYVGGTCANSACHDVSAYTSGGPTGAQTPAPVWTSVDGGQATCTSCHGQPPPTPHPNRADCGSCHQLAPELHVNGHLDFVP